MRNECALLIGTLACSVANKPFTVPEEMDWQLFIKLCQFHAVTPLAYDGLRKAGVLDAVPEEVRRLLLDSYRTAIFRDSQFDYIKGKLSEKLVEANIPHIFLKGSSLKYNYPIPALRTMCDLDVLVHTRDYPALARIAQALGGTAGHSDGNHRNYHFPGGVAVEFHPNLLHHDTPVGTQINPGWQYAQKGLPTSAGELTEEGFYLNTVCHLANHFVMGGVGVRFVLDVWVNRNLRAPQPDRAVVEAELRRFGLLEFAQNVEALADVWFGQGQNSPLLEELGHYILTSGSHGQSERSMLNAVALSPGQSQRSALLKKAFYSREELEDRYPWCKGKPWLLPAAWCTRAIRAVTKRGDLILQWSKGTGEISKEEIAAQKQLLASFGIDPGKER